MNQLTAVNKKGFLFILLFLILTPVTLFAQLKADFVADKAGGCAPFIVSFNNTTTGASGNAVYKWDFGNGNSSSLKSPGALFTQEKTYTVTLTVTDGTQSSTKTTTVTVYKKPTANFTTPAEKVCIPAAAGFTSTSTPGDGNIVTYHWDFGDGVAQQAYSNSINHNYTYEQKPTVSLTVTNSFGCSNSITKPAALEVLGRINPVFNIDKTLLCNLEESIKLTNTSTGPGTLLYKWDFGDGTTSTEKNPEHTFSNKGVYNVRLTVSNTDGCSVTSGSTQVNAAYFNTDFNTRLLCREATFNNSSYVYPSSSLWNFGDGTTSTSFNSATKVYSSAGSYDVTLVNTYSRCKDTVIKTIKVEDNVAYNSAIVSANSVCKDATINFKNSSSVAPSAIFWEFGDGTTSYWNDVNHVYRTPGTYTVKLTNTFGTCKETVTKQITVHALPDVKGFVIDYGGVCGAPVNVKFKDTTPTAVNWNWQLQSWPYGMMGNQQNIAYNFANDGTYGVSLTVKNAEGCSQNVYKSLSIYKPSVNINYISSSSPRGSYDCDSLKLKLNASSNVPLVEYLWNFGDGTTSTDATPEHHYKVVGVYQITLIYKTESGCTGTAYYNARVYDKPKADFNYSIPCGNSLNLQFSDRSPFSDSWNWEFGDNTFRSFSSNPSHNFRDTGKYNVTFINKIGSCSDTITKMVHANLLPSSVLIIQASNTCEGTRGTVTFDQTSMRISSGTWNFGDGTVIPYDTSKHFITHTYTRTGTFSVTLTGTSGNCTLTDKRTVYILLKQSPQLIANKTEICSNDNINIQITGLESNPFSNGSRWDQYFIKKIEYDNGSTFIGNTYNSEWNYNNYSGSLQNFTAGVSKIRVITSSYYTGCSDTSSYINLKVNGPVAGFKITANGICYKTPFIFEDTSKTVTTTALKTWRWDFGDGTTETKTTGGRVEHLYKNPGDYQVRLTVADASGCVSMVTKNISARGPKAAFTTSGLYVPNVPLNTTVNFYNNTNYWYSNPVTYQWSYGDGSTSINYSGSHTYTQPGTNTVMLIANDASINCADTATQIITVKDFNTAFTFSTTYLSANSCPPVLVRINNLSVGTTKVVWDFGDGTASNDLFYPSHTYYQPGTYKITLKTYGYNGLTGTYIDSVTVGKPVAQITADVLAGCVSQTVTLKADAFNVKSYSWDFGDGTVKSGTDTFSTHDFVTGGIYEPRLLIKDAKGCTSFTTLGDKIIIDSLHIAIKGIPAQICDSTTISFKPEVKSIAADLAQKNLIYHWYFGTGNAADTSNIKDAVFNYNKPGTYTVKFKVISPYGCVKEVSEKIIVNKKSKAIIEGPLELCEGSTALFKGNASVTPAEWDWSFGNGNVSNSQNPNAQLYSTPDNYDIRLIVKLNGCSDTAVSKLTVNPKPVVTIAASKQLLCFGETVQLSATGGTKYIWEGGGLSNNNTATPTAAPTLTSKYKVNVINQFGCSRSDSVTVTVVQPFKLTAVKDTFVCIGSTVQLKAEGANTYKWINNTSGLNNINISNPVAGPAASQTYTVVGFDAYGCFTDTATVNVVVKPLPTVVAEPDVTMLAAEQHQLIATASADVVYWEWSPADFLSCTKCASPITTPRSPMDYVVTVKTAFGCTASDSVKIKLNCSEDFVYIPTAFSPNNDGKNDLFYIKGKGIRIIKSLVIYNRWGEMIFNKTNFNIDDASSAWDGFYKGKLVPIGSYVFVAEMQCDDGQPIVKKGTITVLY